MTKGAWIPNKRPVTIIDRPCGWGKTSKMIEGFKTDRKYLVVVPLLSECDRIIADSHIPFHQPIGSSKLYSLGVLLGEGKNIVTTHALYDYLADIAHDGLLDDYHIIIDEVVSVVDVNQFRFKDSSFKEIYLANGYVEVDEDTKKVSVTDKWRDIEDEVSDTLDPTLLRAADRDRLYYIGDGILPCLMPEELLRAGKSLTVLTYKAEGSLMYHYLTAFLGMEVHHDIDDREEREFKRQARQLLTLRNIPKLEGYSFSYNGQTRKQKKELDQEVPKALAGLNRNTLRRMHIKEMDKVLLCCAKNNWINPKTEEAGPWQKGSRMGDVHWVPNTTRGTNNYIETEALVYLYDQYLNPQVRKMFDNVVVDDDYALTEFIQLVWRTKVRKGEPITIFCPSERMRKIFLNWLWDGNVPVEIQRQSNTRVTD